MVRHFKTRLEALKFINKHKQFNQCLRLYKKNKRHQRIFTKKVCSMLIYSMVKFDLKLSREERKFK